MTIEVDQSGKIENTSQDTIIAFSNDQLGSIVIRAKDKREIQRIFREIGKPRIFVYRLLSILIFLLIKNHLKNINQIIIDEEYPGHSALIKSFLLQEIRKTRLNFSARNISFNKIGKSSEAHNLAYLVYKNRREPDIEVGYKEILKFILK